MENEKKQKIHTNEETRKKYFNDYKKAHSHIIECEICNKKYKYCNKWNHENGKYHKLKEQIFNLKQNI